MPKLLDFDGFELLGANWAPGSITENNATIASAIQSQGNSLIVLPSNPNYIALNLFTGQHTHFNSANIPQRGFLYGVNATLIYAVNFPNSAPYTASVGADIINDVSTANIQPTANTTDGVFIQVYNSSNVRIRQYRLSLGQFGYTFLRENVPTSLDSTNTTIKLDSGVNFDTRYTRVVIDKRLATDRIMIKMMSNINPADIAYYDEDLGISGSYFNIQTMVPTTRYVDNACIYELNEAEAEAAFDQPRTLTAFSPQVIEIPLLRLSGSNQNVTGYSSSAILDWTNENGSSSSIDVIDSLTDGVIPTYTSVGTDLVGLRMVGNAYDIMSSSISGSIYTYEADKVVGVKFTLHRITDDDAEPITLYASSSHFSQVYSSSVSASVTNVGIQSLMLYTSDGLNSVESPISASAFNDLTVYFNK